MKKYIISGPVIAQRVLIDDVEIGDLVKCQVPKISYMKAEVKGAGIAGSSDEPVEGMTEPMTFAIDLRSINKNSGHLLTPGERKIEVRVAHKENDQDVIIKIFMTGKLLSYDPGKVEVAGTNDGSAEFNITRMRHVIDGEEVLLIDKYQFIHKIFGKDTFSKIKAGLY